jgi:hypothetical protein
LISSRITLLASNPPFSVCAVASAVATVFLVKESVAEAACAQADDKEQTLRQNTAKVAAILYLKRLTNIRIEICRKDRLNLLQNKRENGIILIKISVSGPSGTMVRRSAKIIRRARCFL